MAKNLIVVESPAKAKTITRYLGKDFTALASYGHVRDLIPKNGAVDTEHDFAMKYEIIDRNAKHVKAIENALAKADALYLATDPDREGEAISWHLYELLKQRKKLKDKPVYRVEFHEITKKAIQDAVANPRELAQELVDAQQARRALDYLVGFNLSPLLWKKIRRGLSAGRVQSPALRLICEREDEIEAFKPREFWTIEALLEKEKQEFGAKLIRFHGDKVEQFTVDHDKQAHSIRDELLKNANGELLVEAVSKKQRRRNAAPPFTTSTLQQEASRKLGFGAQRTMRVAQTLYEGVDIGGETVGLISYMRTDSVSLANEAVAEIRDVIAKQYGKENVPSSPRSYKNKSKNAQEAHEAIRPTSAARLPKEIKSHLSQDQARLYDLIWKRTVASQMIHATLNTVAVDMSAGEGNIFRANGSTLVSPGFMAVYQEGLDDRKKDENKDNKLLPPMEKGDRVPLKKIDANQHFTEPPPRYSEATLVKTLEAFGIGRPSTYASIIQTLQNREYVTLEKKRFHPTDVGRIVNKFLSQHFTQYVDYDFTAKMEDELDAVSRGEAEWKPVLEKFWKPFKATIDDKDKTVQRKDVTHEEMDEDCPKCGKKLSIRLGRNGRFIGCTAYPECDYTRNLGESADDVAAEPEVVEGRECPDCGSPLVYKRGRYGKFIGCSSYPKCKYIEPLEKPKDTGVDCPQCAKGHLLKRKSRRGKIFYSCERYPKCNYAIWNEPVAEPCPECGWPILTIKTTKRRGTEKVCPQKDCNYSEVLEAPADA